MRTNREPSWFQAIAFWLFVIALMTAAVMLAAGAGW